MALYTIGDLHLSGSVHKPMDKFGSRWTDHANKLYTRWSHLVTENDTVMIPGDFSWGMNLSEAEADFRFLASLPGKKILSKGNHDFWWTGVTKMHAFLDSIGVGGISFLHNNAAAAEGYILAGSRGWFLEEKQQNTIFPTDYEKLVNREAIRLGLSLDEAEKLRVRDEEILAFLHFPPVYGDFICQPLVDSMKAHGIRRCYYGHIHGRYGTEAVREYDGILFEIISADYLDFVPKRVFA